jgi:hypothetical protein
MKQYRRLPQLGSTIKQHCCGCFKRILKHEGCRNSTTNVNHTKVGADASFKLPTETEVEEEDPLGISPMP